MLHPALRGLARPRALAARLCSDAAGPVLDRLRRALHARRRSTRSSMRCKLFRIGYSWAGPVSLVVAYDLTSMRARPRWRGIVVRFSLGLEAVDDLIADCEQALARARR